MHHWPKQPSPVYRCTGLPFPPPPPPMRELVQHTTHCWQSSWLPCSLQAYPSPKGKLVQHTAHCWPKQLASMFSIGLPFPKGKTSTLTTHCAPERPPCGLVACDHRWPFSETWWPGSCGAAMPRQVSESSHPHTARQGFEHAAKEVDGRVGKKLFMTINITKVETAQWYIGICIKMKENVYPIVLLDVIKYDVCLQRRLRNHMNGMSQELWKTAPICKNFCELNSAVINEYATLLSTPFIIIPPPPPHLAS